MGTSKDPSPAMHVRVGTCGYSYDDWRGVFYPADLPKWKFLGYYAEHFGTVELNATFYRFPEAKNLEAMAERTPEGFSFVVKAHQSITHRRGAEGEEAFPKFRELLKPFDDRGKLGGVLVQFPYSFRASAESMDYVRRAAAGLDLAPVVAEFRHISWFSAENLNVLRQSGISLCCVDEPDLPGLPPAAAEVTGAVGYVRFHGRNKENWFSKDGGPKPGEYIGNERGKTGRPAAERYRYLYSEDELQGWLPKIAAMESKTPVVYAFFNNHPGGNAVRNARELHRLVTSEAPRDEV